MKIRKKVKIIIGLAMVICITSSFSMNTFAATYDYSIDSEAIVRSAICPMCQRGRLLSHIHDYGPYFHDSYVCSYRPDCFVTVERTDHVKETHCTECSLGYTEQLDPTYTTTHSKPHY